MAGERLRIGYYAERIRQHTNCTEREARLLDPRASSQRNTCGWLPGIVFVSLC